MFKVLFWNFSKKEKAEMEKVKKASGIKDFTTGAILPQIIRFSLPLIATSLLQLAFNTADIVVVGRWGGDTPEACEIALAAVGSCSALIYLIVNLFMGLSVGAGVCVAHDVGAKNYRGVSKVVHSSVILAVVCGVVCMVIGFVFAKPMLRLMNTEASVLEEAAKYMRAYFCGIPACMVYNYCASMLRSTGDSVRPMMFLTLGGIANVFFNLIAVLVFDMGAMGVGVATAISQWVSCILVVVYMIRSDGPCKLTKNQLRLDPQKAKKVLLLGLPAGIQSSFFSISNVLIQSSINGFGKVVVAGNTAAGSLEGYVYNVQNALYHTTLTFVGQNVGARKYDRLKKCILWCVLAVTVIGIVMGMILFVFGEPLLGIFAPDNNAVVKAGMEKLAIMGLTYFLCGVMEVGGGIMRGLGRSITPTVVTLMGSCVFRVVWIYTVFAMFPSPKILYISYPISWLLTAAVHYLCNFAVLKRMKKEGAFIFADSHQSE